jgi:hypothetical protein
MRFAIALLALLLTAPAAGAQSIAGDDLGGHGELHVDYPAYTSDGLGAPAMRVAGVGDVNGDGREDVGVGFVYAEDADDAYITFSSAEPAAGDVADLPGFHIRTQGLLGLAGIGDVNGDGLGDIALTHWEGGLVVVFGKSDGAEVDTAQLGTGGFRVTDVGQGVGAPRGAVGLGDLNGDSVPDLAVVDYQTPAYVNGAWVREPAEVVVVHPPRDAAGLTIDGARPGPHVSRISTGDTVAIPHIDALGDVDGDGRQDLLIAGEEREGIDQVAYGTKVPAPGAVLDVRAAVVAGAAFELRTHDGVPEASGEWQDAITVGDQNGDGRRDVGMIGVRIEDKRRIVRVANTPAFGTRTDLHDLRSDARGYTLSLMYTAVDVGDQNGDDRGDIGDRHTVVFTDPARAEAPEAFHGFWFHARPDLAEVGAGIDDLNGDGKPEIALARVVVERNGPGDVWMGERATYQLDVFDSAQTPEVGAPEAPVAAPEDTVELAAGVDAGAGTRGATTLAMQPRIEVQTSAGAPVFERLLPVTPAADRVSARLPARLFAAGAGYRYRFHLATGRGLSTAGPWREFGWPAPADPEPTAEPTPEPTATPTPAPTPTASPEPTTPPRPATIPQPATETPAPPGIGVVLRGTVRRERLVGTPHDDRLYGLSGSDVLVGHAGFDLLTGGNGRDLLIGGPGVDVLQGGAGADRVDARDGGADVVHCGPGHDTVRADRADRLSGCERRLR